MLCAAGELCTIPGLTREPPNGQACRGGCGGRLHGLCGEVEEPDGDNPMHRICHACAVAKSSTKDAVTAPAGKRKSTDKEGRGTGPWKSAKSGAGKTDKSTCCARLTLDQKLEILQLLDQGVTHNTIAGRFKCGLRTVSRVQEERKVLEKMAASAASKGGSKTHRSGDFPKVDALVLELFERPEKRSTPSRVPSCSSAVPRRKPCWLRSQLRQQTRRGSRGCRRARSGRRTSWCATDSPASVCTLRLVA